MTDKSPGLNKLKKCPTCKTVWNNAWWVKQIENQEAMMKILEGALMWYAPIAIDQKFWAQEALEKISEMRSGRKE